MLKTERAKLIKHKLDELYPNTPIPLTHKNTFQLLIAVLLSAQCTDKRVNEVTPRLFKIAPTAFRMQKLSEKKIYDIIRPCGLGPKKSKSILALSQILVNEYKGAVPAQIELIEALPGVGHKTASVVISQGFGNPAFPVDTHIHRLAQRWGLTKGSNVVQTEKDLKNLLLNIVQKIKLMDINTKVGLVYVFMVYVLISLIITLHTALILMNKLPINGLTFLPLAQ